MKQKSDDRSFFWERESSLSERVKRE
ncbi:hypothetical protein CCACVL1_24812 [Corchorus capsularis]|uniref:Uncharacterized protein n=1 Tax=Corchorus capsularis TaxID=210143 RepID=A0A1R3GMW7_COCAP|nr:hypothetical protein CCACVL1_24812 [Corchorus capsularis]